MESVPLVSSSDEGPPPPSPTPSHVARWVIYNYLDTYNQILRIISTCYCQPHSQDKMRQGRGLVSVYYTIPIMQSKISNLSSRHRAADIIIIHLASVTYCGETCPLFNITSEPITILLRN